MSDLPGGLALFREHRGELIERQRAELALVARADRDRAGLDCPAGIYFVRLEFGNSVTAMRVLRLK